MSAIVLLDTSVYLNVLDVPGFNQHRQTVIKDFEKGINQDDHFLLPLATVWETGNHIAHLPNGQQRRIHAQNLADDVLLAFQGQIPYRATHFPERDEFMTWLSDFPQAAMRNKSATKTTEGTSLADHSIIKEWMC